jgi:hypothetical protein
MAVASYSGSSKFFLLKVGVLYCNANRNYYILGKRDEQRVS